jgi:hypothetical protein
MTLVSCNNCWVLDHPSLLGTPVPSSVGTDRAQSGSPPDSRLCGTVKGLGNRWIWPLPPSLAAMARCGESRGRIGKDAFWRLAVNCLRAAGRVCAVVVRNQVQCGLRGVVVWGILVCLEIWCKP